MHKKYFEKRLEKLIAKRDSLTQKALASQDIEEVRSIQAQLDDLNSDIEDVQAALAECDEESAHAESRANVPTSAEPVNAGITASFSQTGVERAANGSDGNILESMEYRRAFQQYFQRGIAIPEDMQKRVAAVMADMPHEMRAGDAINTGNTGAVIPVTVMREVINTVRKRYGNLYSKVRKMAVQGAVDFPIGDLEANFSWITESTVSPEKEIGEVKTISFKYHTAEIRIAQTFLSAILSIEAFESKVADVIAIAYLKAMDTGIVKGTGNGQMLGILNDARVTGAVGHTIAMSAADINNWTAWRKKFFAKLPLGYRSGEFIFNLGTVDAYLETMADGNNNPIFRQATGLEVNDGDAYDPNGRFFGRSISLVEPDVLPDFDTASSNDVIGIFWQPEEYAINENFGFMMRRYFDDNRNKWINKAITVVDGKILNPNGIYLITKA
jgi:HK97 family phage major capsid protein